MDKKLSLNKISEMIQKQIEEAEYNKKNGIISPSDKVYWKVVKPTYIENWNKELLKYSLKTEIIPISLNEVDCILSIEAGKYRGFNRNNIHDDFKPLLSKIEQALVKFPEGAFFRMGSRSPKDMFVGGKQQKAITDAFNVLELMLSSMRLFEDLSLADRLQYEPSIILREWMDIEKWTEFRCFIKDGEIVAISQYFYHEEFPQIKENLKNIEGKVIDLYNNIKEYLPRYTVMDVVFKNQETILLEINPYNTEGKQYTDPCLFHWNEIEQGDKFDFRYIEN